jgi:hypothetical protein
MIKQLTKTDTPQLLKYKADEMHKTPDEKWGIEQAKNTSWGKLLRSVK